MRHSLCSSRRKQKADALSKLASMQFEHLAKEVRIQTPHTPTVHDNSVGEIQTKLPTWMTPILRYLSTGILPEDKGEALKIQTKASQYYEHNGILYRKIYLGPDLRCVDDEEAKYLVQEVHLGIGGIHAGPRMVVAKLKGAGYYWLGMHLTTLREVRNCLSSQHHAPLCYCLKKEMVPVTTA